MSANRRASRSTDPRNKRESSAGAVHEDETGANRMSGLTTRDSAQHRPIASNRSNARNFLTSQSERLPKPAMTCVRHTHRLLDAAPRPANRPPAQGTSTAPVTERGNRTDRVPAKPDRSICYRHQPAAPLLHGEHPTMVADIPRVPVGGACRCPRRVDLHPPTLTETPHDRNLRLDTLVRGALPEDR